MNISISAETKRVRAELRLAADEISRASVRATNKVTNTARAETARELHQDYGGAKIGEIKARITFKRATRAKPVATLTYSGKRFALFGRFGMRTFGRFGVRFSKLPRKVETIGGAHVTPEMLARAFRQRSSRSGRADVYARTSRARKSLEILVAPGLARTFAERKMDQALLRVVSTRYPLVLSQEAKFQLSRRTP